MVAGLELDEGSVITAWDPEYVTLQDMELFVLNSSKGLAELTRTKEPIVQFIHESVKDFLVKENGLAILCPNQTGDFEGISHEQLKRCCQRWLLVKLRPEIRQLGKLPPAESPDAQAYRRYFSERFPFLNYASDNVLFHADEAAQSIPQEDFLKTFDRIRWYYIHNIFERHEIRRYNLRISLLYILADKGYARLIKAHNNVLEVDHQQGGRYCYPLFAALVSKRWEAFRALLRIEDDSVWATIVEALEMNDNLTFNSKSTPLHWAAEQGNELLFKAILSNSRVEYLDVRDHYGRTPLSLAVRKGHEAIMRLLLNHQQARFSLKSFEDAMLVAVEKGYLKIMRLLLSLRSHMYTPDTQNYWIILHSAARYGHSRIVQLLLDNGAPLEAVGDYGRTALHHAVIHGHTETVRLLLGTGSNVEVQDRNGWTALHHASSLDTVEIAQLVLDKIADINARDSPHCTALHAAAEAGQVEVIKLLIDKGAYIEATDYEGSTALHKAAKVGQLKAINVLLDEGAHIEATDGRGCTALHKAAETGGVDAVQGLIGRGARIEATDSCDQTVLHRAMRHNGKDVVSLLLNKGANIAARNSGGNTALHLAAACGYGDIVELLISMGAQLEAANLNGKTAVQFAHAANKPDVVNLLCHDRGTLPWTSPEELYVRYSLFSSRKESS